VEPNLEHVELWNMITCHIVKSFSHCYLVGICSFGFFLRPRFPTTRLYAYDMDGQFIDLFSTHTIGIFPVEKVTYLATTCIILHLKMNLSL